MHSFKLRVLIFLMHLIVVLGLQACGSEKKANTEKEDTSAVSSEKKELQKVLNEIPKPTEMPYLLKNTGAEFNANFVNPYKNVEKYMATDFKAAVNLGIYATDIGYVCVYEKVQNAIDYIRSAKQLGDKLGISNAFEPSVEKRFESNLNNIDSLAKIIDEALLKSDKYLKDAKRTTTSALIFTGSFIEGLFIATQLIDSYPKDILPTDARHQILVPLARVIVKQRQPLTNLINAMKDTQKDEDSEKLTKSLEELAAVYDKLDLETQIKENKGKLILTDKNLEAITKKVKEIRTMIVN
ncbi:MAG: hypothetical protein NZ551_09295 [Microscillaceae bacterium]|nr:hypothetical protein [Microscillaceae bacterium]MDW8461395.1 hypothetical protein [Cytophagales bacterium]